MELAYRIIYQSDPEILVVIYTVLCKGKLLNQAYVEHRTEFL